MHHRTALRRRVTAIVVGGMAVKLGTGCVAVAVAAFPGANGRLAFWGVFPECAPADNSVAVIESDGSGRRVLSDCEAIAVFPEWSPDGRRLLFVHEIGPAIMRADGSHAT